MSVIDFDPDAKGRGPGRLYCTYVFELVQRPPVIGQFVGVAIGVTKRRDRLFIEVAGGEVVEFPYEELISSHRVEHCPNCDALRYARYALSDWRCLACRHRGSTVELCERIGEQPVKLEIRTGRENREVIGGDTSILAIPEEFIVNGVLALKPLGQFLYELFEKQALDLGDLLHHASVEITSDPEVVKSFGIMELHATCEECQEGVRVGLRWLTEHPDEELIVAQLFWAGE